MFSTFMSVMGLEAVRTATECTTKMLDASYEKDAQEKVATKECQHFNKQEKDLFLTLLKEYKTLFDGTLGDFQTTPVSFKVKEIKQPSHSKAFPIMKIHQETLKKEIQCLVELRVLKKCLDLAW
eukprot:11293880-Ditylum_brightwellii.AAC.1